MKDKKALVMLLTGPALAISGEKGWKPVFYSPTGKARHGKIEEDYPEDFVCNMPEIIFT